MKMCLTHCKQALRITVALIVLWNLCASSVNAFASKNGLSQSTYRRYYSMSSGRLQELGAKWLEKHETHDSALMVLTILSERKTNKKDEALLKAKSLNDLGFLYSYYYYDFKEAYRTLQKADELCEEFGFYTLRPLVELNLANLIYNNDRLYEPFEIDESFDMYKRAFFHSVQVKNNRQLLMIFENLLCVAFYHERIDRMKDVVAKFRQIDIPDSVEFKRFVMTHLDGVLAYASGDIERAIADAQAMRTAVGNGESRNRHLINCYFFECRCEMRRGSMSNSLYACKQAFALAEQHGEKDALMLLHRELENIFRRLGNIREAENNRYQYLSYKDSILNDCQMGKVKKMKFVKELEDVNIVVKDLEQRDRIQHKVMLWMIAVIILLILLVSALIYFGRILQRKNTSLYRSYQEILKKEEEQNRLLKELSDDGCRDSVMTGPVPSDNSETALRGETKYKYSVLDDTMKKTLWDKVLHVMTTSPEIYSPNFSATRLADLAGGMQLVHLSQLIGEKTGSNFYNFLCKYRIREACRMMNSDKAQAWTVEGISMQTGFKSRSNFSTNFKRIVGMTPAQYMKEARKTDTSQCDFY